MRKLLFALLLTSCGDSGPNGNIKALSDYQHAAVIDLCQYFIRCGTYSASQSAACQSAYSAQLSSAFQIYDYNAAIQAGNISFNSSAATTCLDALTSSSCDLSGLLTVTAAGNCANVITGMLGAGAICKSDIECQNGYCSGSKTPGCIGACVAFAPTGGSCANGARCGKNDNCTNSVCVAKVAQGAACVSNVDCATNLFCRNMTCQPTSGEGGPCSGNALSECTAGLFCDSSTSLCKQRLASGAACTSNGQCNDGLVCNVTCVAVADIGQSCATLACAGDATCDATAKTCKLTGQAGDDCPNGNCSLGLFCNSAQKCTAKISFGSSCDSSSSDQCLEGQCSTTSMTCTLVCS